MMSNISLAEKTLAVDCLKYLQKYSAEILQIYPITNYQAKQLKAELYKVKLKLKKLNHLNEELLESICNLELDYSNLGNKKHFFIELLASLLTLHVIQFFMRKSTEKYMDSNNHSAYSRIIHDFHNKVSNLLFSLGV